MKPSKTMLIYGSTLGWLRLKQGSNTRLADFNFFVSRCHALGYHCVCMDGPYAAVMGFSMPDEIETVII